MPYLSAYILYIVARFDFLGLAFLLAKSEQIVLPF